MNIKYYLGCNFIYIIKISIVHIPNHLLLSVDPVFCDSGFSDSFCGFVSFIYTPLSKTNKVYSFK